MKSASLIMNDIAFTLTPECAKLLFNVISEIIVNPLDKRRERRDGTYGHAKEDGGEWAAIIYTVNEINKSPYHYFFPDLSRDREKIYPIRPLVIAASVAGRKQVQDFGHYPLSKRIWGVPGFRSKE